MYSNISSGMKKMFIAEIGVVACIMIALIPNIGTLIGGIGAIVFMIISLIGLHTVDKEVEACKKAFILTIVNVVLNLLTGISGIGGIISIVNTVISFLITYLVCTSLSEVLNNAGAADIADLGTWVWKINLVCTVLGVILRLITLIPTSVFGVFDIILNLLVVIAAVMYLIFLNKGANHLA